MNSDFGSPLGQFRSNVQWFLEGNIPGHQAEMIVDLLVHLKLFANKLNTENLHNDHAIEVIKKHSTYFNNLTRQELQDTSKLNIIVGNLMDIVNLGIREIINTKEFRDTLVQLIIIAESHPDLPFRRAVLELTQKL